MQGNREKEGKLSKSTKFSEKIKSTLSSERTQSLARSIARGALYFFTAFFLSRCTLPFSSRPFGFALLCASRSNVAYVLGGCVFGALTIGRLRWIYLSAYVATILLRLVISFILVPAEPERAGEARDAVLFSLSDKLTRLTVRYNLKGLFVAKGYCAHELSLFGEAKESFYDSSAIRALLAASCAFFAGLCTVIIGGFAFYDVFGLMFTTVCAPAAAFIYSFLFEKRLRGSAAYEISMLFFAASFIFACRKADLLGLPIAFFAAFLITLTACKRRTPLLALIYAALLGLAISPPLAICFLLAAIIILTLGAILPRVALFVASSVSVIGTLIPDGILRLAGAIPAVFAAGMIHLALEGELAPRTVRMSVGERIAKRKKESRAVAADRNLSIASMVASQTRMEATEQKLKSMSASFGSLSEVFFSLSDKLRRPAMLDLRKICSDAFENSCRGCAGHDICHGLEYSVTLEVINRLASKLHTRGYVETDDIPTYLRSRCENTEKIVEAINADCARLTEAALRGERNEIFALDYSSISKILNDTIESEFESYGCDMNASTRIYDLLTERGHSVQSAVVLTGRRKQIILSGIAAEEIERDLGTLKRAFSQILSAELSPPSFERRGTLEYAYFTVRKRIRAEHASLWSASGGKDKPCGDSVRFFNTAQDLSFSLISDGMGSGGAAALTSGISAVFLEKMLGAGNKSKTSIRMLNDILRSRASSSSAECSASIDLAEIDLIDSSVSFTKCGAAPSFVIRNSKIYKINASSAPIGILESPDTHVTRFPLKEGDLIIMVSDGAICDTDDTAFIDFLSRSAESGISTERLAELIMANARVSGSKDDVSCTVIRILKNDKK